MTAGFPQHSPPKRKLGTGWIIAIVAIAVVVVLGIAAGAYALLHTSKPSYDAVSGKYGATLPTCDEVANRVGNLPPKSSDTELQGSQGWLCTFTGSAGALSVHLDLEVNTAQRQRTKFDIYTSSSGYTLDPSVQLGEKAAWGLAPSGQMCELAVLDDNAGFKVGVDDAKAARGDTQTCENRAKAVAKALYDLMQPR